MQLWIAILEQATFIGCKRNFDDEGKPRRSRWYFEVCDEESEDSEEEDWVNPAPNQVYQTINLTTEQANFMKDLVTKKSEDERTFKIRGIMSSSIDQKLTDS